MADERCELRITRRYDASPTEVWAALTDLERWLAPPPGVTVLHAEAERRLELDWRPRGEPPSTVNVELRTEGGRTLLVLEHTRIDATLGMRYLAAWGRALDRFEAAQ
jgi:uncharacterized protein YndB with AHSA1/START domain